MADQQGEFFATLVPSKTVGLIRYVPASEQHYPKDGDVVGSWLKARRDLMEQGTQSWYALNDLVELYKVYALGGNALPDRREFSVPL